ncbi:zinc finger CDGSH-type domain protein [Chloroherpeton thalassium ATCC 35110]|uniref:Zinc finger CDGSH-type domain protein n=1 Tax=Chloroherpeton thalassium (strain ATCC 35110 / GB-78) TaxID=517418 RepID=B3QSY5_CHLT3|nr:CDGSH iron-sulfur domain-containing protein [Chloroherpeton thalassium]ACF12628.1 zinc finger CDGSH-type domain protein [Chloroherpeton thalassium ATCC 35110]
MSAKITVFSNGPIKVEGDAQILDMNGAPLAESGKMVFLCRCGHTQNTPYCDGSHKKVDFKSEVKAENA